MPSTLLVNLTQQEQKSIITISLAQFLFIFLNFPPDNFNHILLMYRSKVGRVMVLVFTLTTAKRKEQYELSYP